MAQGARTVPSFGEQGYTILPRFMDGSALIANAATRRALFLRHPALNGRHVS